MDQILLSNKIAQAIMGAFGVMTGAPNHQFGEVVIQGGSVTSTNMNTPI